MIPDIPTPITLIVLLVDVAIAIAVWSVIFAAADRPGAEPTSRRRVLVGTGAFLGIWLAAAILLAPSPASLVARDPFTITPVVPILFVIPIAVILLARWRSPSLRRVLAAVPLPALVGLQIYRTVGIVFVILLALGQLPAHFALPAGWGDVAIGVTAPLVALALVRGVRGSRTIAVAWNLVGLIDLAVAFGMGTGLLAPVLVPSLGSRVPAAAAMGAFPMILVPTFAVPISVVLHAFALGRLLGGVPLTTRLAPAARSSGRRRAGVGRDQASVR